MYFDNWFAYYAGIVLLLSYYSQNYTGIIYWWVRHCNSHKVVIHRCLLLMTAKWHPLQNFWVPHIKQCNYSNIRYHSIITSHLHVWTHVVPHRISPGINNFHVMRRGISHGIYTRRDLPRVELSTLDLPCVGNPREDPRE